MNQKGYADGYSRILDRVAGDQVPNNLDLAPTIMLRIQKRKGFQMRPRHKLFPAIGLVAMVMIVLLFTVPGMAAAIGRWFGYVPGIGFVREGQIRVLTEPVSVTREGVIVTVDQVVLDPERTALIYTVEGISNNAIVSNPKDQHCPYKVALRLPDKRSLTASPEGLQYWGAGYQHRFVYPPIPAAVNEATLVIDCLFNTRSGTAPENWEIPLRFVGAPPDMTAFPVIEIPTQTALATVTAPPHNTPPTVTETAAVEQEASPQPVSMALTLDRAVQMEDGYLIYATIDWKNTPFAMVDLNDLPETLHLLDANRQEMLYERHYDEQTRVNSDQRQTVFAIKTAPVHASGPLTLVLDSLTVHLQANTSFVFDPGPDPKPGQTWTLNQDVKIDQYNLRVRTVTAKTGGYSFEMSSDTGIFNASVTDTSRPMANGGGGGGDSEPGENFISSFNYADGQLPEGPVTVTVMVVSMRQVQHLEAQWTPPAVSSNLLPTQPAACLTEATWKTAVAQQPPLPNGLSGRVLLNGQLDKPRSDQYSVALSSLDGTKQQVIQDARDGAISPDGTKLAYSTLDKGLGIMDLATGQTSPIPGTGNGDFNPLWSPDGKQIVFNRGMGIFDLFIVEPDGANMRQITHGGVQEWPAGWLPDGRLVYTVPGQENEYTNYVVDTQSGKTDMLTDANLQSISPDGNFTLTSEKTFGDRWLISISGLDGANRWLLNDASLWIMTPVWSPDGQWLLAGVSDTDPGSTIGALINLRTCQVIPLPNLRGNFLSWTPDK